MVILKVAANSFPSMRAVLVFVVYDNHHCLQISGSTHFTFSGLLVEAVQHCISEEPCRALEGRVIFKGHQQAVQHEQRRSSSSLSHCGPHGRSEEFLFQKVSYLDISIEDILLPMHGPLSMITVGSMMQLATPDVWSVQPERRSQHQ